MFKALEDTRMSSRSPENQINDDASMESRQVVTMRRATAKEVTHDATSGHFHVCQHEAVNAYDWMDHHSIFETFEW